MTRRAWAYLARTVEGPHPALNELLGKVGPEEAAERIKRRAGLPRELAGATESRHHVDRSAEDLDIAARHGFRLVAPDDDEWPVDAIQHFLGSTAPGPEAAPPHALWVRGSGLAGLVDDSVAMVGTRAATSYGVRMTERLAAGVARAGATVVSGGALGIDAVAHRTALEVGGRTVVVAACGPGVDYPAAHVDLFRRVGDGGGAIVTEYPPGVRPARHRFLTRNRLVAGLTGATVLVEAGWRSGARNTAAWARHMNRPVGAVPGPAASASSTGCHDAIREGDAVLVTGPDHVLALYRGVGSVDEDAQLELDWAADPVQSLGRNELRVYDATPTPGAGGSDTAAIAGEAGLTLPLTMHLLLALEGKGLVVRDGSAWRRAGR